MMSIDQLQEVIQSLEEQKAKTTTPIIIKNCERNIKLFTRQLAEAGNPKRKV